jgi:hypothetical protein
MTFRDEALNAAEMILGKDVYVALKSARISTPRILEQAGREAFIRGIGHGGADILRRALAILDAGGTLD